MTDTLALKTGDLLVLQRTIRLPDGSVADLTGAQVTFAMRYEGLTIRKIADAACTIVDALTGVAKYTGTAADTGTPGLFEGEFHATLANGQAVSYPEAGYIAITVAAGVDAVASGSSANGTEFLVAVDAPPNFGVVAAARALLYAVPGETTAQRRLRIIPVVATSLNASSQVVVRRTVGIQMADLAAGVQSQITATMLGRGFAAA